MQRPNQRVGASTGERDCDTQVNHNLPRKLGFKRRSRPTRRAAGARAMPDDRTAPDTAPDPIPLATPPLPLYRMRMGAAALTLLGANALTSPLAQLRA